MRCAIVLFIADFHGLCGGIGQVRQSSADAAAADGFATAGGEGSGPLRRCGQGGRHAATAAASSPGRPSRMPCASCKPGDTLYLRGGTYYEHVTVTCSRHAGEADHDPLVSGRAGHPRRRPARVLRAARPKAWEPCPGRRRRRVSVGARPIRTSAAPAGSTNLLRQLRRFDGAAARLSHPGRTCAARTSTGTSRTRSASDEDRASTAGPASSTTCKTGRIHVRLAHTHVEGPGRRTTIAAKPIRASCRWSSPAHSGGSPLTLHGAQHRAPAGPGRARLAARPRSTWSTAATSTSTA